MGQRLWFSSEKRAPHIEFLPPKCCVDLDPLLPPPQFSISLLEQSRGGTESLSHPIWSLVAQMENNPPAMQETWVRSLGQEDPLKKGIATHSCILIWRILWREKNPMDRGAWLQSMGSQRAGHDWTAKHTCTHMIIRPFLQMYSFIGTGLQLSRWSIQTIA